MPNKKKTGTKEVKTRTTKVQACTNKRQALSQLRRKKWDIKFRSDNQKLFYDTMDKRSITLCTGPAGTGKSFISIFYALQALADKKNNYDGIILCRPLIPIDNESIGYLPGELENKVDPYMMPYWQAIEKLVGKQIMNILIESEVIKVIPLAFFRGLTLESKIVLYDEAQNSTSTAMKSFLTRIGDGSKMVVMGDIDQTDRKKGRNGLEDAIDRLYEVYNIGITRFTYNDIVRHELIGTILSKYEEVNNYGRS